MAQKFNKGDKVTWSSGQGEAVGTVKEYITEERTVEGQTVSASKEDPRYLVENESTGNVTGHKPETLSKANGSSSSSSSSDSSSKSSSSSSSSNGSSSSSSNSSAEFSQGDKVEWNTPQGKTSGKVVKKLTSDTEVGGTKISASKDDPRYLVESEKTGKQAAHKPSSLSQA